MEGNWKCVVCKAHPVHFKITAGEKNIFMTKEVKRFGKTRQVSVLAIPRGMSKAVCSPAHAELLHA